MWDDQFQTFAQQYMVVRYDLPGFGKSEVPAGLFAHHENVSVLFEHLGIKQAHIIATSFGGLVALDFTLAYPEKVTSPVLCAPDVSGHESTSTEVLKFAQEEAALLERSQQHSTGSCLISSGITPRKKCSLHRESSSIKYRSF